LLSIRLNIFPFGTDISSNTNPRKHITERKKEEKRERKEKERKSYLNKHL
jgi:hypothetical protein